MKYSELPTILQWQNQQIYRNGAVYQSHGASWLNSKWLQRSSQVFPGVFANSPDFANAKIAIEKELAEAFPEDAEQLTVLRTDMDEPSSLGPLAPVDNRDFRKEYNCRTPKERDLQVASELIDIIIKEAELQAISHRDVSSSGAPLFIKGSTFKKEEFRRLFKNRDTFLKLVNVIKKGDYNDLKAMDIAPFFTKGERKHFVKVGKERRYITPEFYPTETRLESVVFEHPYDKRLHCYDRRFMYAAPTGPNMACQMLNNALMFGFKRAAYFARYNGESELSNSLKQHGPGRVILSLDKRKFGETFCNDIIHLLYQKLQESRFKNLSEIAFAMSGWPIVYTNVRKGINDIIVSSEITERTPVFEQQAFCSGHGLVAFKGQLLGSIDALLMLEKLIGIPIDVRKACEGYYDNFMWFLNKGDDTIISIKDNLRDKLDVKQSLHSDEIEEDTVFLGYEYTREGDPYTTRVKFAANTLLPERDYRNKTFPKLGHLLRYELYTMYGEEMDFVLKVINENLKKHCRFDYIQWLETKDFQTEKASKLIKSEADMLFVTNPEVINYKLDPAQVSNELLRHYYHFSEPEEFRFVLEE